MKDKYTNEQIINGFIDSIDKNFVSIYAMLVNDFNKASMKRSVSNIIDSESAIIMNDTPEQSIIKRPGIEQEISVKLEERLKERLMGTPLHMSMDNINADLMIDVRPYEYRDTLKPIGIIKYKNSIVVKMSITNHLKTNNQSKTK